MQKNSGNFSMEEAMRLAKSPAGQQLISHLQEQDPDTLNKAMAEASGGNYTEAKQILSSLMQDKNIQQLIKQFGERNG